MELSSSVIRREVNATIRKTYKSESKEFKKAHTEIIKDNLKSLNVIKWIIVENTHQPIVSEQLFKGANAQIAIRKRGRRNTEPHLFSGLVKCDTCIFAVTFAKGKR